MDVHFKMIMLKRGFLTNELRVTMYQLLLIARVTSYFLYTSYKLLFIPQVTNY